MHALNIARSLPHRRIERATVLVVLLLMVEIVSASPRPALGTRDRNVKPLSPTGSTGPTSPEAAANAQVATATITLQPVPPQTVPPSSYPPGTTIVGQEITLGSVPARVWVEVHVTGWAPQQLKTVQVKLGLTGAQGSRADCNGEPAFGAGNVFPALTPCISNTDCRALMTDLTAPCPLGTPLSCNPRPNYFPAGGNICEPFFINKCHPQYIGTGVTGICAGDPGTINFSYGCTTDSNDFPDFHPSYLGTLVLDVPANAKGTYTIGYSELDTFLQDQSLPVGQPIPIAALNPALITAPCGRCCYGYASKELDCIDTVSAVECGAYLPSAVFQPGEVCPENGGPDCPDCATDADCYDGVFCNGSEICDATGVCVPGTPLCASYEFCDEETHACIPRIPTISTWGLVILTLSLTTAAKLRFRAWCAIQTL